MRLGGRGSLGPLVAAGVVLGFGYFGIVDGIVFHQLLRWHHFVSSAHPPVTVANLRLNVEADGVYFAVVLGLTTLGLAMLWEATRRPGSPWSGRAFAGGLVLGAGLLNLLDSVVDHLILGVHHFREGPDAAAWDLGLLGVSIALTLAGWSVARSSRAR